MISRPAWFTMLVLGVALAAVGCEMPAPPGVAVSGTITLEGSPLPDGQICFISPTEGRFETFVVKSGSFSGRAGLGTRRIEICAFRDSAPRADEHTPGLAPAINYLPEKYSTHSTLTADVTEAGPNVFTFNLKAGK